MTHDHPEPRPDAGPTSPPDHGRQHPAMISTDRLSDLFVEVADTLVADFDLVDFLITLCEHASLVSGADAVGIVLTDQRGDLRFMASSNDAGRQLEMVQMQANQGPCIDCVRTK